MSPPFCSCFTNFLLSIPAHDIGISTKGKPLHSGANPTAPRTPPPPLFPAAYATALPGGCPRCNDGGGASGAGLATCLCIHAEENALLEAGRERIRDGAVLYCDTCPCLTCSIKVCQVGIREVVYAQGYSMDIETAAVFREAGVKLRQFVPPPNGLIQLENVDKLDLY
ncbi:deoxycytidylate deaminase [Verticillium dahliae VdLs.17]|uniref:dCMP deaminase n=1 Tax=Verticillium dahliae (strain VdLs.17 / ATCC MYA-4575 / FGSC 10137) TaxID=498257 RepID=G2WR61_VERDV|nr:deoxycytidylate deaminase [Verticillium dahliae VdLs.17]EGY13362.1 deoxycytidylate deaminase [Verticillium dahliae VdLs.17]